VFLRFKKPQNDPDKVYVGPQARRDPCAAMSWGEAMRVLVTGGAGYVGTRLANALTRAGHHVRVLDALFYGSYGLQPDVELRRGDICMRSDAARAMSGIEVVFHLAEVSNDSVGDRNIDMIRLVNIEGTRVLLDEARKRRVRRFIFGSSMSVLGLSNEVSSDREMKPGSSTSYSQSKYFAEQLVIDANQAEFETAVIRQAPVCGPSPRQRFDTGVNAMVGRAYCDGIVAVSESHRVTSHLAMDDAIRIYLDLLDLRGELIAGEVFDAGWEPQTNLELAMQIRKWVPTRTGDFPVIEVRSSDPDACPVAVAGDPTKLENVLGIRRRHDVRKMVEQLVQLMEIGFLGRYDRDIYHHARSHSVRGGRTVSQSPSRTRGFGFLQRAYGSLTPSN
jgi:nucleoside-diphosphate-sugar epimerase